MSGLHLAENLPGGEAYLGFYVLGYLALASVIAFLAFGLDKDLAQRGERRVSESMLLLIAALGGSPGAKLGQHRFRHKTRKQPFRTILNLIVAAQIGVAGLLLVYSDSPVAARLEETVARFLAEP